jgi:hypothetical protein
LTFIREIISSLSEEDIILFVFRSAKSLPPHAVLHVTSACERRVEKERARGRDTDSKEVDGVNRDRKK